MQKSIRLIGMTTFIVKLIKNDGGKMLMSMTASNIKTAELMNQRVQEYRESGNSIGGIIECQVENLPAGIGEPVFDKLDAVLAHAMLSIGAIKGIEFGKGFDVVDMTGAENNDDMRIENGKVVFDTNNAGGILGGMSNGNTIVFRLAVKAVPSIYTEQRTIEAKINPDIPNNPAEITFENTTLKLRIFSPHIFLTYFPQKYFKFFS